MKKIVVSFAMDDRWITVKPNGADKKGKAVQIDDEGRVKKGMGGKFTGQKINEVSKKFVGAKTPSSEQLKESQATKLKTGGEPEWFTKLKEENKGSWNGTFYKGRGNKPYRIFVGKKDFYISEEQKQELEEAKKEYKAEKDKSAAGGTYLNIPYEKKNVARENGAEWDSINKKWFLPEGVEVSDSLKEYVAPAYDQGKYKSNITGGGDYLESVRKESFMTKDVTDLLDRLPKERQNVVLNGMRETLESKHFDNYEKERFLRDRLKAITPKDQDADKDHSHLNDLPKTLSDNQKNIIKQGIANLRQEKRDLEKHLKKFGSGDPLDGISRKQSIDKEIEKAKGLEELYRDNIRYLQGIEEYKSSVSNEKYLELKAKGEGRIKDIISKINDLDKSKKGAEEQSNKSEAAKVEQKKDSDKDHSRLDDNARAREISRDLGIDAVKNAHKDGYDLSHVKKSDINSLSKATERFIRSPSIYSDLRFASYRDGATFDARQVFNSGDIERLEKADLIKEVNGWDYEFTKKGKYMASIMMDYGLKRFNLKSTANDSDSITLAMDESQRIKDDNGNLTVLCTVITKEGVNPYRGKDIPNSEALGLDPEKVYYLYRPIEEIEKAIDTFKRKPVLIRHVATTAKDPKKDDTIGTTGSDLIIEDGKLYGDIEFWDDRAIALIEEKRQEQLSAGYGYTLELTPGEFNGKKYDGVMRNLHGNHVALVERGRIGNDAIICDNQTVFNDGVKIMKFKKGGLERLTQSILMAFDSDEGLTEDKVEEIVSQADEERDIVAHDSGDLRGDLARHGLSDEIINKVMEVVGGIDGDKKLHQEAEDNAAPGINVGLSQDQINDLVSERLRANDEKHEAINEVKEDVGSVNAQAHDSAASVYKLALDHLDVDLEGVEESAYKSLYKAVKATKPKVNSFAGDADTTGYKSRFIKQ